MQANHKGIVASMERLIKEVKDVNSEYHALRPDNAFVLWFAEAYLVGDRKKAFDGIIGGKDDKTVDAVYVDERNRIIQLVQGKYHQKDASDDADVYKFAERARDFWNADFAEELKRAGPGARKALLKAHSILHGKAKADFTLKLYFASTGRITPKCEKKAKKSSAVFGNTEFEVLDRAAILAVFASWLQGSSPPLPELEIGVDGPYTLMHHDGRNGLQGWIFTTTAHEVCRLFSTAEERLFARNVRGYLGSDSSINSEIIKTATKKPERFWFLNNGITITADRVEKRDSGKHTRMRMWNPQVVNGQQTVRALANAGSNQSRVLVRLIRLVDSSAAKGMVGLVGEVVKATNRQNAIKQADLMSNDPEQVRIEREFRKYNYAYERRRQDSREFSEKAFKYRKVKREYLANAVSATALGAHTVRRTEQWESNYGKLFSENRPMSDYLARWWAAQQVSITRSVLVDARWVVLACLWRWSDLPLRNILNSEIHRRAFIEVCEQEDKKTLSLLHIAAKQLFIAAKPVYTEARKRYAEKVKHSRSQFKILTPDAFFRQKLVSDSVMKAARSNATRKHKITSALKEFRARLLTTG